MASELRKIFPACTRLLPERFWEGHADLLAPDQVPAQFDRLGRENTFPGYLADLARAELAKDRLKLHPGTAVSPCDGYAVNPALEAVEVGWRPLLPLLDGAEATPRPGPEVLLFWVEPGSGALRAKPASAADLLALKIVAEGLEPRAVARETGRPVGVIDAALDMAVDRGLILSPPSALQRPLSIDTPPGLPADLYRSAEVFTLQWHITHSCDLHCRHCYDRSDRVDVPLRQVVAILDQLRDFCRSRHVRGQVSFSGGNPFLHPDFLSLYQAATDRNLMTAVLGNPVCEEQLDALLAIARPVFFQVSLEGLQPHNDYIRGPGNFAAVLDFLALLKQKQIYSMVMLTLTSGNLDQVLPLAELLRERTDLFTYNRLAPVGEGAALQTPGAEEYRTFTLDYLRAREHNPVLALKDSLLNISLAQAGKLPFGGCTGFGCGAAFNFVSLLPDGEVHACRKFSSPIGSINRQTLAEIYDSAEAERYRHGCRECIDCRLRLVCGGCLAVACGCGLDPLDSKDPACFYNHQP